MTIHDSTSVRHILSVEDRKIFDRHGIAMDRVFCGSPAENLRQWKDFVTRRESDVRKAPESRFDNRRPSRAKFALIRHHLVALLV
jgi:hypothetical protein